MDEKDAWNSFFQSGSVPDYLRYKAILRAVNGAAEPEDKQADEVQNQGTDTSTAEYR